MENLCIQNIMSILVTSIFFAPLSVITTNIFLILQEDMINGYTKEVESSDEMNNIFDVELLKIKPTVSSLVYIKTTLIQIYLFVLIILMTI